MAATHGVGVYGNGAGVTTPLDLKMAQLGPVVKTAANTIRPGLFWDGNATVVSGKVNMSLDVRAFAAVTTRGATAGAVLLANDALLNVTKDTTGTNLVAPGSNSVYWNVFIWQREFSLDGTDSNPVIGVLVGTAGASPSVPALTAFPGAISLATVLVPSGTTATNSGTTITQVAPFTAASGGVVMFRNSTERDASILPQGTLSCLISDGTLWSSTGAAWVAAIGDTGWIVPALLNSWVAFGAPYAAAAHYRRINGVVYLAGLIKNGVTTSGTVLFNLPAGFRPLAQLYRITGSAGALAVIEVKANGDVIATSSSSGSLVLDVVPFPAEQ